MAKVAVYSGDNSDVNQGKIGHTADIAIIPGGDITWTAGTGAPTDGVAGTGAGTAGKGSLYTNLTTGDLYVQQGTVASPEWHGVILA